MSKKNKQLPQPPIWAANAVPTSRGWVDARTGSLLVAVQGLLEAYEQAGVPIPRKTRRFEKRFGNILSGEERRIYRERGFKVSAETTKEDIARQQLVREEQAKQKAEEENNEVIKSDDLKDAYKIPNAEPTETTDQSEYQVEVDVPNVIVDVDEDSFSAEVNQGFDIDTANDIELEQYARENHDFELDRRYAVRKLRKQVHALEEGKSHEEVEAIVKKKK